MFNDVQLMQNAPVGYARCTKMFLQNLHDVQKRSYMKWKVEQEVD